MRERERERRRRMQSGKGKEDTVMADQQSNDDTPGLSDSSQACSASDNKEEKNPKNPKKSHSRSSARNSIHSTSSSGKKKSSVSKYRGVAVHRWTGRWESHIWENGKQLYLGSFETEEKAARAYDKAAIKLKKENAVLNFDLEDYKDIVESLAEMTKEELITSLRRQSAGFARGTSTFRGVSWRATTGRWEARIGRLLGRKYTYLGTFTSGEAAARAYDHAAIISRGKEAITNYHLNEYKEHLEKVEKATPEERLKMEEQLILRPQAMGAEQRRRRFEASTSDSQVSGKSQTSVSVRQDVAEDAEEVEARKFKRIKSCPPAMLSDQLTSQGRFQRNISVNLTVTSSAYKNSMDGARDLEGGKLPQLPVIPSQQVVKSGKGHVQRKKSQPKKSLRGVQKKFERSGSMKQRMFQRTLTGNVRVPRRVVDPSLPYQPQHVQGKYSQHPMYHPHFVEVPKFKPNAPTPIEKVDLLIGDYFSGLPDGTECTWEQMVSEIEQGYPEPIGAMLGMTGSDTTSMPPPPPAYVKQESLASSQPGQIFNSQLPTQNTFQWHPGMNDAPHSQYISEFDKMIYEEGMKNEMLSTIGMDDVQNNQSETPQAERPKQDQLAHIDNMDGGAMTKILIDLGFSGDNLFTWHT